MRTILVTGGAGYVGSHCCKALAQAGWRVTAFDDLSRGWRDMVRWGPLIEGDVRDLPALRRALQQVAPDAVVHVAALAYVEESMREPGVYYDVNVTGTPNVLRAMRGAGVERLVFSSSCATYGVPDAMPILEDATQRPINPYGWSKLFAERVIVDFAAAHGLRHATLRYFNAAGADLDGEIGERHAPEPHLIPLAIRRAQAGGGVFTVNGEDFDTPDGTAVRDYVHVADLASAHVLALEHLMRGGGSEAFNLGTGVGTSVEHVVRAVERAAGRPIDRLAGPRRPGDPPALVASGEKARRVLGWTPRHSSMDEIVTTAWRWHAAEALRLAR